MVSWPSMQALSSSEWWCWWKKGFCVQYIVDSRCYFPGATLVWVNLYVRSFEKIDDVKVWFHPQLCRKYWQIFIRGTFHSYKSISSIFLSVTFTLQNPETTPAAIPYCELKNITNVKALNAIYHVWNYIHDGGKSEFCLTAAFIVPPLRKRLLADKM